MTASVRFSAKRKLALEALLLGATAKDAAKTAGVAEKTARRWLSEPSFTAALQGAQDAMLAGVTRRAVCAMTGALDTLTSIMGDPARSASVRVAAARTVLDCGLKLGELCDLAQRVSELEKVIHGDSEKQS